MTNEPADILRRLFAVVSLQLESSLVRRAAAQQFAVDETIEQPSASRSAHERPHAPRVPPNHRRHRTGHHAGPRRVCADARALKHAVRRPTARARTHRLRRRGRTGDRARREPAQDRGRRAQGHLRHRRLEGGAGTGHGRCGGPTETHRLFTRAARLRAHVRRTGARPRVHGHTVGVACAGHARRDEERQARRYGSARSHDRGRLLAARRNRRAGEEALRDDGKLLLRSP